MIHLTRHELERRNVDIISDTHVLIQNNRATVLRRYHVLERRNDNGHYTHYCPTCHRDYCTRCEPDWITRHGEPTHEEVTHIEQAENKS